MFNMELFFNITKHNSNKDNLMIIPLYLVGDAKLWWHTKVVRAVPSPNQVIYWEIFKKELKAQFYPKNVAYDAHCKLGELQQTGSIWDYVRDFSHLMLNIMNMQEED